jgi:hypothetical protein
VDVEATEHFGRYVGHMDRALDRLDELLVDA